MSKSTNVARPPRIRFPFRTYLVLVDKRRDGFVSAGRDFQFERLGSFRLEHLKSRRANVWRERVAAHLCTRLQQRDDNEEGRGITAGENTTR